MLQLSKEVKQRSATVLVGNVWVECPVLCRIENLGSC